MTLFFILWFRLSDKICLKTPHARPFALHVVDDVGYGIK
jgi:hypothetical protein